MTITWVAMALAVWVTVQGLWAPAMVPAVWDTAPEAWAPAMVWALGWNLVMDTVLRVTVLVDMDQTSAALQHHLKQKDQTKILFRHAKQIQFLKHNVYITHTGL